MRNEQKIFKLIGIKDDEVYVVDEAFSYDDGMKGVTFSVFTKMNADILLEKKDNFDYQEFFKMAVEGNNYTGSLKDFEAEMRDDDMGFYDSSYQGEGHYDDVVEQLKQVKGWEDTEFLDCIGGGRSFATWMLDPENFDFVSPDYEELKKILVQYEV